MSLKIQLRFKHHELLLHAFAIRAEVVVIAEMLLQSLVVLVIVWLARVPSVTDEAALVLHPAMLVELVVIVKSLPAETTEGMALETGLIRGTGFVVTTLHVLVQFLVGEQFVLVREDLFVSSAKVAHAFMVMRLDVSVKIWPSQAGEVAGIVGAVVSEQQDSIADNIFVSVFDANVRVGRGDALVGVLLEPLVGIVRENDKRRRSLSREANISPSRRCRNRG